MHRQQPGGCNPRTHSLRTPQSCPCIDSSQEAAIHAHTVSEHHSPVHASTAASQEACNPQHLNRFDAQLRFQFNPQPSTHILSALFHVHHWPGGQGGVIHPASS
eukprot:TRINITY_DN68061_c0_g2_i1.p1 TRINITY_DN68061_c0_g2~~TRINITY_DN68061_c0_g2_i1.p1  ORF type:complete len:104 (+),score=22.24 TRINITY_DN68061_c0_g2_i1:276-587(+)